MSEFIKELVEHKDITIQQILNNLLDGNENLDLKTHIFKPKQLAGLKLLASYLKQLNYPNSSELITEFIETYLRYMVSYKRMSRSEIIKALTSSLKESNDENLSTTKKMTQNLK